MHIIIIEDTEDKLNKIVRHISDIVDSPDIRSFSNIGDAIQFMSVENREDMLSNPYDWIVITDMGLPWNAGDDIEMRGGIEVLDEMDRVGMECPVIVQSYEFVGLKSCIEHYPHVLGTIQEDPLKDTNEEYRMLMNMVKCWSEHMDGCGSR